MPEIAAPISFASVTGSTASWRMRSNASPNTFNCSYPLPLALFACADAAPGTRARLKKIAAANLIIFRGLHKGGCTVAALRADSNFPLDRVLLSEAVGDWWVHGLTTP